MHLQIPGYTMGETMGVATNSKGHLFVYSRTNPQGIARGGAAAMLWEFDQNGKYREGMGPAQLWRLLRPCRARRQERQCLAGR